MRQIIADQSGVWCRKLRQAQDFVDKSGETKKNATFAFFPLAAPGAPP
jgi:hypothetical protein